MQISASARTPSTDSALDRVLIGLIPLGLWLAFLANDWITGVAPLVLWAGWRFLPRYDGPPVLAMAFTFQWVQVVIGLYYTAFTARQLAVMSVGTFHTWILISLCCLLALLAGLCAGHRLASRWTAAVPQAVRLEFSTGELAGPYVLMLLTSGIVGQFAWQFPAFTQAILALSYLRLGVLFLLFRRLIRPRFRWGWIILLLVIECGLGVTGYFAGFREPLMIFGACLLEGFDRRSTKQWLALAVLGVTVVGAGLWWTAVKMEYRKEFANADFMASREARLKRLVGLSGEWLDQNSDEHSSRVDDFIDRMWQVYYPSLALERVPEVVPHTHGDLIGSAIRNLMTPRFLYSDKPVVRSDSELVRTYAGVMVSGYEEGTSFAFGYTAESYVDFGVPGMFVPIFMWGWIMGALYAWFLRTIHNRELAIAVVTVIFWFSLYLYERSWLFTFGMSGALVVYVGGASLLVDGFLQRRQRTRGGPSLRKADVGGVALLP